MRLNHIFSLKYGIYYRLLAAFLIVIIPIYMIGFFMNRSGVNMIREQIIEVMQQKVDFLVSSMDAEIARIALLQVQFMSDNDLQTLSIRPDTLKQYQKIKLLNDLHSKLEALSSSSDYIAEAVVLMPNSNKRLSSLTKLDDLDMAEYDKFRHAEIDSSGLVFLDGQYYLCAGFPIVTKNQYMLVIRLSMQNIGSSLGPSSYIQDNANGLLFPSQTITPEKLLALENDRSYLKLVKRFQFADWTLMTFNRADTYLHPVDSFRIWNWIFSALAVTVVLIVSYFIYRLIHSPLRKMVQAFKKLEGGQFDINLEHRNSDEFQYLYMKFNQMVSRLHTLVQQVYEQTIRSQQAELKHLQSQINPHFLYNSLYMLYRMAQDEDLRGVSMLSEHLGDYFKFITQNKADYVTLDKELQHAAVYAAIQQLRLGDRIVFHWDIVPEMGRFEVPRLIVQPLLENAIIHGHQDTYQDGWIRIMTRGDHLRLELTVEDNGKGMTPEQLQEWEERLGGSKEFEDHALCNVHRRLQLRYGAASGLELQSGPDHGLIVKLTIVWEEMPNHV